jgi:hypothetical protein
VLLLLALPPKVMLRLAVPPKLEVVHSSTDKRRACICQQQKQCLLVHLVLFLVVATGRIASMA